MVAATDLGPLTIVKNKHHLKIVSQPSIEHQHSQPLVQGRKARAPKLVWGSLHLVRCSSFFFRPSLTHCFFKCQSSPPIGRILLLRFLQVSFRVSGANPLDAILFTHNCSTPNVHKNSALTFSWQLVLSIALLHLTVSQLSSVSNN